MRYQAEMLAHVLRLAQERALELVRSVPAGLPRLEQKAVLLQQEVLKVQRQALALQQQVALQPQEEEPLLELGLPQEVLQSMEVLARQGVEQLVQQALEQAEAGGWALAKAMEQVDSEQALVEAEAQVEVLEPQAQELVQAPLLAEDWVGWVQTEKE